MPRKIRQLIAELQNAGFVDRGGKGSHRNFYHSKKPVRVVLSGNPGKDAKPYQEKLVKKAVKEVGE